MAQNEERTPDVGSGEEDEPWVGLLERIDSTNFSKPFRNLVLVAGLLHLRESSEDTMKDLQIIIQETDSFSTRIASAKEKHPEANVLISIERNLGEFSLQTDDFRRALMANELRGELELLSLCLLLSRSATPEGKGKKTNFAGRITRLARHIKFREGRTRHTWNTPSIRQSTAGEEDDRDGDRHE